MPKFQITSPEGKTFEVTGPEGSTQEQALEHFRSQYKPEAPKAETPKAPEVTKTPFGLPAIPDPFEVAGKLNKQLARPAQALFRKAGELDVKSGKKTPEQAERSAKQYGQLVTDLAEGVAVPFTKAQGLSGSVGRILQSGLLGAAQTGKPVSGGLSGLVGGAAGEGIAQIPRFWQMAKAARSQAADKAAFDKAMTETLSSADRAEYQKLVSEHEAAVEQSASRIAEDFKRQIPAWKDYPSGTKGLQEMVTGKGQDDLSAVYDAAIAGKQIAIQASDAKALGLKAMRGPKMAPDELVEVSADQANRLKGALRRKDPIAYDRVNEAIQNVLPPEVRQQYSAGQALINFVDKSGALKGDKFNPEALVNGMNRVKIVNELRRRGQGDVFRGPLQAARGVPTAPGKPPVPRSVPEQGLTEGVKKVKNPMAGHPWLGGLAGEAVGHMAGAPTGLPFAIGALTSQAMPKELVTQARLTPEQLAELARVAGLTGTGVRSGINNLLFPPK